MMRGVSTWAVAVRKPSAEQLAAGGPGLARRAPRARSRSSPSRSCRGPSATGCCGCRSCAAWWRSASRSRSASRRSASRPTPRSRPTSEGEQKEIGGGAWAGTIVFALLFAVGLFFLLPAGPHQHLPRRHPQLARLRGDREARPDLDLPGLPVADLAHAGPPAGVRVPRRRAQDDLLLRGRPAAHARERASSSRASIPAAAPASCCS